MNGLNPLRLFTSLALLSLLICTTPASVAIAQESELVLEEIVVTARKREESLQDTPISIAAFTGVELERQHIDRLDGIARQTPNLVFNTGTFTSGTNASASVWIRGIGQVDFTLTTEPGVGVYIDDAYVGTSIGSVLDLVDIERVEVLRGPQGTLFGRNTIGGAISVTSKLPDDQFRSDVKVTTGSYDRIDARASINGPLTDTLFANFAAATFNRDGFVDTPNAASSGKLGDIGRDVFRGALRFVPNDRFEANLTGDYSRARENSFPHVRIANYLGASLADIAARRDPTNPAYRPPPLPVGRAPSFVDLHNILVNIPFVPYGYQPVYIAPPTIVPNPVFGQPSVGPDDLVDIEHDDLVNPSFMDFATETDVWGLAFNWSYDFGWSSLKSITSYREIEAHTAFDYGSVPVQTVKGQTVNDMDAEQFTQEFQLTGEAIDSRLNWLLGFYYFQLEGLDLNDVEFTSVRLLSGSKVDDDSTAGFAQVSFDITDRLSVTGGLRYTDESKKFIIDDECHELPKGPATLMDGTVVTCTPLQTIIDPKFTNPAFLTTINAPVFPFSQDPNARLCCLPITNAQGNIVGLIPGTVPGFQVVPRGTSELSFSEWTPMASVAYQWTDDLMTYLSYSEGFKSGGFVQRVFPPKSEVPSFEPETATVYEVGFKWTGLEGRMRVNAAAFHTEYEDLHVQVNDGIAPVTRNAAAAEIDGFELEVTALPGAGWLVEAGVGYLDAGYTELDPSENFVTDIREITLDSELAYTPEWSTHLGLQYSHRLGSAGGTLIGRVDWSYRSEIFLDALNFPEMEQGALHLVDVALTYVSPQENWELSAFGKNVTDERYLVSGSANGLSQGRATAQVGRPDEWGLSFTYRFGN
jgi:iron complex outermembrane receptor protein